MFIHNASEVKRTDESKKNGFVMPKLSALRASDAYKIAYQIDSKEDLIIGRGEKWRKFEKEQTAIGEAARKNGETFICKRGYVPEASGLKYDRDGNMAFIIAGVEAARIFEIWSTLEEICQRAEEGLNDYLLNEQLKKEGKPEKKWDGLGGAFPELTWLVKSGYTFQQETDKLFAVPSRKEPIIIKEGSLPNIMQKKFADINEVNEWIAKLKTMSQELRSDRTYKSRI